MKPWPAQVWNREWRRVVRRRVGPSPNLAEVIRLTESGRSDGVPAWCRSSWLRAGAVGLVGFGAIACRRPSSLDRARARWRRKRQLVGCPAWSDVPWGTAPRDGYDRREHGLSDRGTGCRGPSRVTRSTRWRSHAVATVVALAATSVMRSTRWSWQTSRAPTGRRIASLNDSRRCKDLATLRIDDAQARETRRRRTRPSRRSTCGRRRVKVVTLVLATAGNATAKMPATRPGPKTALARPSLIGTILSSLASIVLYTSGTPDRFDNDDLGWSLVNGGSGPGTN